MVLSGLLAPLVLAVLGHSTNAPGFFSRASLCATIKDNVSSDTKVYFPGKSDFQCFAGPDHIHPLRQYWMNSSTSRVYSIGQVRVHKKQNVSLSLVQRQMLERSCVGVLFHRM
jgi:hypothetical protein